MTTPEEIAQIAAGLSVAQRRAVLNGESPKGYARSRLLSAGIFEEQADNIRALIPTTGGEDPDTIGSNFGNGGTFDPKASSQD